MTVADLGKLLMSPIAVTGPKSGHGGDDAFRLDHRQQIGSSSYEGEEIINFLALLFRARMFHRCGAPCKYALAATYQSNMPGRRCAEPPPT